MTPPISVRRVEDGFLDVGASYRADGVLRGTLRCVRDVLALPAHISPETQRDLVRWINEAFAEAHHLERYNGPPADQ